MTLTAMKMALLEDLSTVLMSLMTFSIVQKLSSGRIREAAARLMLKVRKPMLS